VKVLARKTIKNYLEPLLSEECTLRIIVNWKGVEEYMSIVDGTLVDVGDDYLAIDREPTKSEKEQFDYSSVNVMIPFSFIVQIIIL